LLDPVTTSDYSIEVKSVGIKQLKARLSEYVRLVKSGETVLVTDRDEVVAEIRPARRHSARPDDLSEVLASLADAGEITRSSQAKGEWTWRVRGLRLASGTARAVLDEVRADREPSGR
jgi:antitoxin (DNA-binding transcriptional repressor) of toxin-antitoxin stability system